MSSVPVAPMPVSAFQTGEAQQGVFRVLLDAMARPGTVRDLPVLDGAAPVAATAGLAAVAQTLLDHEVTFAVVAGGGGGADEGSGAAFSAYTRAVTGCREVAIPVADYVFVLGGLPAELATQLKSGQPAYPDEGATLVSLVPPLEGATGLAVDLAGPGVPPGTVATVPGWSVDDIASLAQANADPPLGIDVILVDADGRVMCLPRSTRIALGAGDGTQEAANGLHRG